MASGPNLPTIIATSTDLKRTRRELELLEDFLHQSGLRQGGSAVKLPKISRQLEQVAEDNKLNLLKKTDRDRLRKYLTLLLEKAPVLHFTFASEPSGAALNKLLMWLRNNIHPQVMVSVGIQPAVAAGCMVRTANRQFDFTLRQSMDAQAGLLIKNLRSPKEGEPTPQKPKVAAEAAA